MPTRPLRALALAFAFLAAASPAGAQRLTRTEQRIRDWVRTHQAEETQLLADAVNISSGTMNPAGVRAVGTLFERELRGMGFETRWIDQPSEMHRASHLFAERRGSRGKRLLLIGHLDTVFEGEGQHFDRVDSVWARGAGSNDMKGGDVVMLFALKALQAARALDNTSIIVAFSGDEESAGEPISISRRDMIEAAHRSDVALAFETGSRDNATVARRGASAWMLRATGRAGHSSGIFSTGAGYGANYELARILDGFREALAGQPNLTLNVGMMVGGNQATYDTSTITATASGKNNIIPQLAMAGGDLRFLTEGQKDSARARMREIVANHLPGTSAEITFSDAYPAMSPTPANYALLAVLDSASRALGDSAVAALDPGRRGAGDISFVAPFISGLDGLGAWGTGAHSPEERVYLPSLPIATERAAILIYRLTR